MINTRRTVAIVWAVAMWTALARPVSAQPLASSSEPVVAEKAGKELHAWRIASAPPRIDGLLDDDVWTRAASVDDFVQNEPLARPMSYEFAPVTLDSNPDFNTKSLNSNIVFRWEYLKGSALFVVWNRSGSDAARPGTFTPLRDLGGAFGADGSNVFLVKWTYWMGL